jgi:nicotinamide mononucleotide (NMN) deamidase PncC
MRDQHKDHKSLPSTANLFDPTNKLHQTTASVHSVQAKNNHSRRTCRQIAAVSSTVEAVMKKRARGKYPEATAFACTSTLARPTNACEPPGTAYVHVAYAWTRREESVENREALQLSSLPRHQPLRLFFLLLHSPAFCHVLRATEPIT